MRSGDRLRSGPPSGVEEALTLVERKWALERAVAMRGVDRDHLADVDAIYHEVAAAVRHARRVWREEQEAARLRAMERLRADVAAAEAALDDEAARWLGLLADALERGEWSALAI